MKKNDKLIWHTEKRKISELTPYERNPRRLTDKQGEKLKESLEKFDLVEIPAIDTNGKIVAGHMRVSIMRALGRGKEKIDVRVPSRKLTKEEFKEYNIRSNANTGEWDWDILGDDFELDELKYFGFGQNEIKKISDFHKDLEFQSVDFKNVNDEKKKIIITFFEKDFDEIKKIITNLSIQFPGMNIYV